jgi:beta-mannosidase
VQLLINDQPIFCRGVCWTLAPLELDPDPEPVLKQAKKGGANMIRVGGTMVYAAEALLLACDREGVLLWQDFMFANMDYPFSDGAFFREVEAEVKGILEQHSQHPCIAVYCGNSEVEQQAAMLGFPASERQAPFFYQTLPEWLQKLHPGIPYVPSTPCEGALPFHTDQGLTHYYGVGAYRRPLSDIRAAEVKFTPECLGFSNVPDDKNLLLLGEKILPHHPVWKSGVPRDSGAGWDFEDIRDFYLKLLFGLDPIELRSTDFERYLALSRVVTGELMLRAYAEWRQSGCGGALIWFLKDLRPGAGWGILDSTGMPKPVWWFLKRAWARQAVLLTDEGLNGVGLCVYNETEEALEAVVELELLQEKRVGVASVPVKVGAFGRLTLSGEALLGNFGDLSYAYRFGPPRQRVVVGRLKIGEESVAEDALFPAGYSLKSHEIGALKARLEDGALVLESTVFVQHVSISCSSYLAEDNYFHLCPGVVKRVRLEGSGEARALKVELTALNLEGFLVLRG